ncbi:AraC family transcriptional regulator [Pseudaminobacter soli (ex Li et al. 2025)]|uniref:AraC family transcriptional regulator n=1 Tax=Pseudaminobacter soli (ex Li et al. 2025) TaxID=1295366 RepID=A0A2P7S2I5_9HYPH|nr:AraC family transcriptional regulator [Mesorhizobium soli]PSJ56687.1 AraC family transcriptional regulator [Mesorhizobium soli]
MSEAESSPKTCASLAIVWPHPPGAACFAVWKAAISRLVDSAIPDDADIALFDFHGCTWQLPETFVQINGGSAITMSRSQKVIDDRPISQMSIYMLTGGSVVTDYDGLKHTQLPGDVVVVDYSLPYEALTPGYEGITLTFDRARAPLGLQGDVHGTKLSASSAAGKVIGAQMRTLIEHIDELSVDQAQSAADGILQFAATAFPAAASKRTRDDLNVLHRAHRLARKRMSDPDFGPEELASELGMSRSKLFRSFEIHGGVQRWLLGERLTASLQAIVRGAGKMKISAIAHQHGFRSEAHFSRAFRKRYDMSPSDALALTQRSQGSALFLSWAENDAGTESSTVEAWLASAQAREAKEVR